MDIQKVIKSFPHAFRGISLVIKERNMRVHILAVFVVSFVGVLLQATQTEWLVILLCYALVMSLETVNTALEDICNKLRDDLELDYKATRNARDISAGAVLIGTIFAVIISIIIFLPKVVNF